MDYQNNNFNQDSFYEADPQKVFSEPIPEHMPQDLDKANTSMIGALLSLGGGVFELISIFFMNRISYMLSIAAPVVAVFSVVMAIMVLKNDRGIPKAYIGLIVGLIAVVPGTICVLLAILNFIG